MLATYGDPSVRQEYRRGIFGLFQDVQPEHPRHIKDMATRFAHLKSTVHAVLFLFREKDSGVLNYSLQQVLVWNRSRITAELAQAISTRIHGAIPGLTQV